MREWIETNGLGGYASLSSKGSLLRKYHGLLIASLQPPSQRWMIVSNCLDAIETPAGPISLVDKTPVFSWDLFPRFHYRINDLLITKTFFQVYEKNMTGIRYEIKTSDPVMLRHTPVVNFRHIYDLCDHKHCYHINQEILEGQVRVQADALSTPLLMMLDDASYQIDEHWRHVHYPIDEKRHDACEEYVMQTGRFEKHIPESLTYHLLFSLADEVDTVDAEELYEQTLSRRKDLVESVNLPTQATPLLVSADRFVVKKGQWRSLIAGYHWFSDWGRDTLIALPGCTLVPGRFMDARAILFGFHQYCKNGLIPNTFDDRTGEAAYNTVDASLWFVDRVFQYMKYTNDTDFLISMFTTIQSIIEHYMKGTDHGIGMDVDYLISHDPGLTWMDVKMADHYPTPRSRKAVEIQALWYNALRIASVCARYLGLTDEYEEIAYQVKRHFVNSYDKQYDVIDTRDVSCRPNKIFLVSLDFPMISPSLQKEIVSDVRDQLVTIFGLRTLAADDDCYLGSYLGNYHRDLAYHNGTVWPWLLGPYLTAFVKVHKQKKKWRQFALESYLDPMFRVFGRLWDGSIPEIFDGDPPYAPRGCMNQAWSVAEILRAWVEDILQRRPVYERNFLLNKVRV